MYKSQYNISVNQQQTIRNVITIEDDVTEYQVSNKSIREYQELAKIHARPLWGPLQNYVRASKDSHKKIYHAHGEEGLKS